MQQDRLGNAPMQLAHAGRDGRAPRRVSPVASGVEGGDEARKGRMAPAAITRGERGESLMAAKKTCRPEALASDAAQLRETSATDPHFAMDTESVAS